MSMLRLHKEGREHFYISVILILFVGAGYMFGLGEWWQLFLTFITMIFVGFSLIFFRHPVRQIPELDDSILYAPADGRVVVIEEVMETTYLHERVVQVSIFMSPLNVHVNRVPISGVVDYVHYDPGKYLVAWHPKSSELNERNSVGIQNPNGHRILVRQIAGAMARRIVCYLSPGDRVTQGAEMGFIKLGSRVDVFLPLNSEVLVQPNQKVKGNITAIARLNT